METAIIDVLKLVMRNYVISEVQILDISSFHIMADK